MRFDLDFVGYVDDSGLTLTPVLTGKSFYGHGYDCSNRSGVPFLDPHFLGKLWLIVLFYVHVMGRTNRWS